ncbi:MAG: hypothetical protein PHP01_02295 [Phycisphaerae bacterium]|nr:hypothetical protein [Phycisphaerae bacterium]
MKVNIGIPILLLVCIPLCAKGSIGNPPTAEQIDKMASAAWKEPVTSIDITLYKHTIKPPKSVEEIRQMFENALEDPKRPKEQLSPQELEQYDRNVQLNVERTIKVQETGSKTKERIRIDGYRQRIDSAFGWPEMTLLKGTPPEMHRSQVVLGPDTSYNMTYINLGDEHKGDYRSFTYYHGNKSATMTNNKKTRWAKSDIMDFARLSSCFQGVLGVSDGTISEPVYIPDVNKIEELQKTGLVANALRLTITPEPNAPDSRDRIEIKSDEYSCGIVIICDKNNYSRIYCMEICNPGTGKPLYIKQFSNFDDQDFPHNATIIEYDANGNLKNKEIYTIEKVELNPILSKDVFEFAPPEEYEITVIDPNGTSEVVRPKGGIEGAMLKLVKATKEKDIGTLTELLGNEIWQVRLRSLQVLDKFLDRDKGALKEAAAILKNDEKLEVRNEAQKILNRLESNDANDVK